MNDLSRSQARAKEIDPVRLRAWLNKVREDARATGSTHVEAISKFNLTTQVLGFFSTSRTEKADLSVGAIGESKSKCMKC